MLDEAIEYLKQLQLQVQASSYLFMMWFLLFNSILDRKKSLFQIKMAKDFYP